jgi:hypothetical protein
VRVSRNPTVKGGISVGEEGSQGREEKGGEKEIATAA